MHPLDPIRLCDLTPEAREEEQRLRRDAARAAKEEQASDPLALPIGGSKIELVLSPSVSSPITSSIDPSKVDQAHWAGLLH